MSLGESVIWGQTTKEPDLWYHATWWVAGQRAALSWTAIRCEMLEGGACMCLTHTSSDATSVPAQNVAV